MKYVKKTQIFEVKFDYRVDEALLHKLPTVSKGSTLWWLF